MSGGGVLAQKKSCMGTLKGIFIVAILSHQSKSDSYGNTSHLAFLLNYEQLNVPTRLSTQTEFPLSMINIHSFFIPSFSYTVVNDILKKKLDFTNFGDGEEMIVENEVDKV
jgi:hypothetical protein